MTQRRVLAQSGLRLLCAAALGFIFQSNRSTAWAETAPVGPEFQVNTHTTASQSRPRMARDSAGNFIVVWASDSSPGTDTTTSMQGQRYDDTAAPLGTQFQINTYTTFQQAFADVASDPSGNFVVVWTSDGSSGTDSSDDSVQGQRFDSSGAPAGTEFQVNTYTTSNQGLPSVDIDSAGNFVVVWRSDGSSGTDSSGVSIQAQRFDSSGVPAGTQFQVNTYTTLYQSAPDVATDSAGNFVVVWESLTYPTSSVRGRRFDSAGAALGPEFQIESYVTSYPFEVRVGVDSADNFMVVWTSFGSEGTDTSNRSVQGRRFDSSGVALGTQFQVNTSTTFVQQRARVGADTAGTFVVVWQSDFSSGSDTAAVSVQAQRFDGSGAPLGTEFQVNTYTTNVQEEPAVVAGAADEFVVAWHSNGSSGTDSSSYSIQAQRFGPTGPVSPCGPAPEPDGSCSLAAVGGAGKSSLQITNKGDNTKDALKLKWGKGVATGIVEFKMPDTATATYRVCIYDGSGNSQPLLEIDVPNGGVVPLCGTDPCWSAKPTSYKYKDKAATAQGVTGVTLKAGSAGKAQVQVKAKGALLAPPDTAALVSDVVVQLLIDDGITTECFKTTFPAAGITLQTSEKFKVKGP